MSFMFTSSEQDQVSEPIYASRFPPQYAYPVVHLIKLVRLLTPQDFSFTFGLKLNNQVYYPYDPSSNCGYLL